MRDQDFRNRFRAQYKDAHFDDNDDISKLWDDQKKMQREDKKLELELKLAKQKAKEIKKTLISNRFGDTRIFAGNTLTKYKKNTLKLYRKAVLSVSLRRKAYTIALTAVLVVVGVVAILSGGDNGQDTATLGESLTRASAIEQELPREEPTGFKLLYPGANDAESMDVVRISPDGADPSYTYLDRFTDDGAIFRVTQQEVPSDFNLSKTANDFQASNVIQLDEILIYHGYSDKGGVQTLIFIKDNKLVFIRSPQRFTDDMWASYVLSLK